MIGSCSNPCQIGMTGEAVEVAERLAHGFGAMDVIKIAQPPTLGSATIAVKMLNGKVGDPAAKAALCLRAALVEKTVPRKVVGIL